MFKLYSKGCQYALRALACVVDEDGAKRFQAKEICQRAGIPESFTRKIFQSLVQGGFLEAHRGPGGGYALKQKPEEISLVDVIRAVDGDATFDQCIMGLSECRGDNPCPLHQLWASAKGQLLDSLEKSTLIDLVEVTRRRSM